MRAIDKHTYRSREEEEEEGKKRINWYRIELLNGELIFLQY